GPDCVWTAALTRNCSGQLKRQTFCVPFWGSNLLERALPRLLLRTPAQKFRPMAEASSREVVVLHFANSFRFQRLPFGRAPGAPTARAAGSAPRESWRADHRLNDLLQLTALLCIEAR